MKLPYSMASVMWCRQTGLLGRWQCIGERPLIICDTAHNKEGISPILKQLESISKGKKLHIVWGMVSDKDHAPILQMLPKDATYYFCRPDIPRGLDATSLLEMAQQFSLSGSAFTSVNEAMHAAKSIAMADDIVFIGGSTFVVAEVV
jgi:dihydrofolate synthase/folylpolyglutamate synthase